MTEETKRKLSRAHTGKTLSPEHRAKVSASLLGNRRATALRGKPKTDEHRRRMSEAAKKRVRKVGWKLSDETRARMVETAKLRGQDFYASGGLKRRGQKRSSDTRAKMSTAWRGRVISQETRRKMSVSHLGDKSPGWRGGITPINLKIRQSVEYKLWREAVFRRDNYTCVLCATRGDINADHIKAFSSYPSLRFSLTNGRTLCVPCHKDTDNYGYRARTKVS